MSFASLHTRKNIGCCIIKIDNPEKANDEAKKLNLMPEECNQALAYLLTEEQFKEQGMELNKFYTKAEMEKMGFEKTSSR
jgi:hypothetical protein